MIRRMMRADQDYDQDGENYSKSTVLINDQDDHEYDNDENNQDDDQHGNQDDGDDYDENDYLLFKVDCRHRK